MAKSPAESGPWEPHADTVSGGGGNYQFSDLEPGWYRVTFGFKPNYAKSPESSLDDEAIDSNAMGYTLYLNEGETRDDIDAGYYPISVDENATFTIPENSPAGTFVGDVSKPGATSYSITTSTFEVTNAGVIKVVNSEALDYEVNPTHTFNVIAHMSSGPNVVIHVTVNLTNVNEGPEYDQSTQLQGNPYHWVSLTFEDPEGDDVVSVNGDPQNGVLLVNQNQGPFNPQAYWVPFVGATGDQFTLSASDGTTSGEEVDVTITVTGQPNFGQFQLGTTPPPKNVDTDPPATGNVADIPFPARGWNTEFAGPIDYAFHAWITTSDLYLNSTPEAKAAMDRYLANTGAAHVYDLHQVLSDSTSARASWIQTLDALIGTVDSHAFVGMINLIDKQAHLGSTGGSVWEAAIGQYTGWGSAEVTGSVVQGKVKFDVEFTYHLWDPYDWDPTKRLWGGQPPLANLHLAGLAKQYMTTGTYTVNVSWFKGEAPTASAVFVPK